MCSGKSSIFNDLNACYNCGSDKHPFDIRGITPPCFSVPECTGHLPAGGQCATVKGYSFGYFKMAVVVYYPGGDDGAGELRTAPIEDHGFQIYPNPTTTHFSVSFSGVVDQNSEPLANISILDLSGNEMLNIYTSDFYNIDVSSLPSGLYLVKIQLPDNRVITQPLIKM